MPDAYHHGFLAGYWPPREPLPCPYEGEQRDEWERGRQDGIRKAEAGRIKPLPTLKKNANRTRTTTHNNAK